MRIGYDAKRIFHNRTGLGNYGRDIIRILNEYTPIEEFFLFNTRRAAVDSFVPSVKTTVVYPKNWFWKTFPSLWRLFGQWKQIKSHKLSGFHGLSGEIPIQFWEYGIPKIVTIHDLIFLSHPQYYKVWDRIIYKLKFRYAVKMADHVIAISEQTKSDIITYFKTDPNKITVIYQGCNDAYKQSYSTQEREAVRKKHGLPSKYIINVGTLQERKNVLPLIKAIHGTDYHLVLIGKNKKYAKKLYSYVEKNALQNQVSFLKNIDVKELAILYQNATVFCYPSICEGFGIPIIEAMYSRTPVIVTKGGCFPEAAGPDAIYIDPKKVADIKEKLEWIFNNPEERKRIAEKGYTYVQRFSDDKVGENLMNLYKAIL